MVAIATGENAMADSQNVTGEKSNPGNDTMVRDMHRQFLEALRSREQQIVQFLAILVPTLGAFLWLLRSVECEEGIEPESIKLIAIGAMAAIFLLCVGAVYAVALGYNFRSVVMQMAKIEWKEDIRGYALEAWPRKPSDFKTCYCDPPEMIMVFWLSFQVGIVGVVGAAWYRLGNNPVCYLVIFVAFAALLLGGLAPLLYGCKLTNMAERETKWQADCDKHTE